jgi:WD40 repeat protein
MSNNRFAMAIGCSIKIWEASFIDYYQPILKLEGHSFWVHCLLYKEKEDLLISSSFDKTIKIWKEYICIKTINVCNAVTTCLLSLHGGYFASGRAGKDIIIWSLFSYERVNVLEGHRQEVLHN